MRRIVGCFVLVYLLLAARVFLQAAEPAFDTALGSILVEYWRGVPGTSVAELTRNPEFPEQPDEFHFLKIFEIPSNQDDNYGTRVCGYVIAPETGNYVFWIASDDGSELWLSSSESPKDKKKIAFVNEWAGAREWERAPSQKSAPIALEKGKRYFIEALHKEGGGQDNLAVGWQLPNGTQERPIPGNRLAPIAPPKKVAQSVSIKINTPPPAKAGPTSITGIYTYKNKEYPFGAVLYLQEGYFNSQERYPTLTSMHNVVDVSGGTTGDFGVMNEGMGMLMNNDIGSDQRHSGEWPKIRFNPRKEAKFIGILPQCPKDRAFQSMPMSGVIVELINWVDKNYRTDPGRAYLTGFSYGGSSTWAVAQCFPERFAAIVPLSARIAPNAQESPEILKNVGVWCGVGQQDGDFFNSCSKMAEIYTAAKHSNFHFTVVKDGGHHCYQAIYGNPDFWKWLLAQRRKN